MDDFKPLTWDEVCADRHLHDLPFRIELNGFNQIVMTPLDARHSRRLGEILRLLQTLLEDGTAIPLLPVQTADNVKVIDATWAVQATVHAHDHELDTCWSSAPEICVEVLSPTNTRAEMTAKRGLYFERGAQEVWVCSLKGEMSFYSSAGKTERSAMCPKFPLRIKI